MIDILLWPWLGGMLIAATTGPLGAFVVWRRMAYFGDTLAHAALLGVALGWMLHINLTLAVVLFCLLLAILLSALMYQRIIATDTLLGILSHSSLAVGLVIISLFNDQPVDLMAMLFGDLLAIGSEDMLWISLSCAIVLAILAYYWQPLLNHTICPELAHVEGVNTNFMRTLLFVLIAMVIAIAMKIVGILLITSLLIIPAASARRLATTPEQMAMWAALLGCFAATGGMALSWIYDTPAGPSVVVIASAVFFILYLAPAKGRR
ncbi:MAG: zinc ABC transporter permease subunit ZnuB [Gammaproteobacteria bacterium]|jgi:zinc transport system permease protein|nr:zinc ABC transporter permease subunit ZnuB [Gammaproteobacteria bacterium]MDP6165223.1 zinc ABC transporter permease subunit ZnuB [Gammaproteobacteria bacterium]